MAEASVKEESKPSNLAIYVTVVVTSNLLLGIINLIISVVNISDRAIQVREIRQAVSSAAAEARVTARGLQDLIERSRDRWDYLSKNNPDINTPNTSDSGSLVRPLVSKPTPLPTATPKVIKVPGPVRYKTRAAPKPTPFKWPWNKSTR